MESLERFNAARASEDRKDIINHNALRIYNKIWSDSVLGVRVRFRNSDGLFFKTFSVVCIFYARLS